MAIVSKSQPDPIGQCCERSQDALFVAEALSAQIEHSRSSLDHRSLFSAGFNRKLVRRIEILDVVREEFLNLSHELLAAEREVVNNAKVT